MGPDGPHSREVAQRALGLCVPLADKLLLGLTRGGLEEVVGVEYCWHGFRCTPR